MLCQICATTGRGMVALNRSQRLQYKEGGKRYEGLNFDF